MSIKIKSLKIRNFRGIGELDLDFTDPDGKPLDLVVLAGPNGCGKTSVLEAILIACGRKEMIAAASAENPQCNVKDGAKNFEIEADALLEGQYVQFHWEIKIERNHRDRSVKPIISERVSYPIHLRNLRDDEMHIAYFSSWRGPKLVGALPITAGRKGKRPAATDENRLWIIKQTLINEFAYSLFKGQIELPLENEAIAKIQRLNSAWQIFYPAQRRELVIEPKSENSDEGFDLFMKVEGIRIPVDQLSSGEIEVLTMAGWFTMNDYRGGIVLIDEPELHMHVQWHRAIMRALRVLLPETQIIVATHSWDILKSVMSYERFTLLREGDPRIAVDGKAVVR
ncbi:MAG: AAA family ATPase [Candidatus Coatesbacteria bacterium]|nr:AAA family ATPase [Candidatus Coatesbacteria bacterium]